MDDRNERLKWELVGRLKACLDQLETALLIAQDKHWEHNHEQLAQAALKKAIKHHGLQNEERHE